MLNGWLVHHEYDSRRGQAGFPDLVLAHEDYGIVYLELKKKGGRISPEQHMWLQRLRKHGQRAAVVWPRDLDWIADILAGGEW